MSNGQREVVVYVEEVESMVGQPNMTKPVDENICLRDVRGNIW